MMKEKYFLSLIISIVLVSCSIEGSQLEDLEGLPVSFNASLINEVQTRVVGSNWESGDKIGVFAIKHEANLHDGTIVENYDNLSFSTSGNGVFHDDGHPIYYPKDGSAIDFISYYPYRSNLTSYSYPIDISEQVDFLYSNNLKNASKNSATKTLSFNRVLSKLVITVEHKGEVSLEALSIEIDGIKTKASFSLANGTLNVDEATTGKLQLSPSGTAAKKEISCLLLPTTEGNSIKVVFKLNDNTVYTWTVPHALQGGQRYSYQIKLNGSSGEVTPSTSYMEIPYYTSGEVAPNSLKALHMVGNNSWLNGYSGPNNQRNYTVLFDTKNAIPLWIAYPMHPIYMTSGNRTNAWGYDPIIPKIYQPDNTGWTNSTYNRGHMLASADRSASRDLNKTTFYATNMVPQNTNMNSGVWNKLEEKLRDWAHESMYDTLYVVTGSLLASEGQIQYTTDKSGLRVAVPKYLYKALLRQEKSSKKYYSIAFKMENTNSGVSYKNSVVSVAELEIETGFTFFPNLSDATEIKKQKNMSHWN